MVDFKKDVLGKVYDSVPNEDTHKEPETALIIKTPKRKIYVNKYSGNGRLPLHESVIIGIIPEFVTLPPNSGLDNGGIEPTFLPGYESELVNYLPNGTVDSITPLPYVFSSEEEFKEYLKLAAKETYDSLYLEVDAIFRKYVNVEEYYYPILAGDTIWSYFQDRFGYTHYLIFTGNNGSGKNSALLVFRYLGYRVFYVVSANAANYYTAYGSIEEGQVCVAEDEADDIGKNKDKTDILKSGYQTGGVVPKIELEGGRSQDCWLVYGIKWLAMEELKIDNNTKGILHRSLVMKFLPGDVPYNIKDVIRSGDDPEYKPLYEELIHVRKLLFCFRLLHYKDLIPMVKLNVKGRTNELTKPYIRLFQNSRVSKKKILDSLSEFMLERKQNMLDSFEAKLLESVQSLINLRLERKKEKAGTNEDRELGPYTFTNESIKQRLIDDNEAEPDPDKKGVYYSTETGPFGQAKITSILRSKFKAKFPKPKKIDGKTHRCVEFKESYLKRLKASYEVPDKIKIVESPVTVVTPVTPSGGISDDSNVVAEGSNIQNDIEITKSELKDYDNSISRCEIEASKDKKKAPIVTGSVTSVTSVTKVKVPCSQCGELLEPGPFYQRIHRCDK